MGTTLELDEDVADALKEQSLARNLPLAKIANDVLRQHVCPAKNEKTKKKRFRVKPFSLEFAPEFDGMTPKEILNKLDEEYYAKKLAR